MTTNKVTNRPCVIKSSYDIYFKLFTRIRGDLNLRNTDVAADAQKCGRTISDTTLIKYWSQFDDKTKKVKSGVVSSLSQDNILWLCKRYGIECETTVTVLPVKDAPYWIEHLKSK